MEPATFKYNERQISLKIDKATPKLIIRLLKVPGYNFALNSEEGDCIEPRGEEHFSEPLESGTLYTVLDLNDESDRPRSPQSAGEVTFVHQDESGRELVWKTNSQGLTFDRVASHFSVNVESMILVDNEGRPFEDGASLQLQNGMTYQVHGDPASHRRTSGAGNSQASSFHSNSRSQQVNNGYQEESDRPKTCDTISLQMDHKKAVAVYKQVEGEMFWNSLTSIVSVVGILELLTSLRLSLRKDFDLSKEFTFAFKAVNDKAGTINGKMSARRALYDVCASIQDVYDFMRNKMNEMAVHMNLIPSHVLDSMEVITKLKSNSKNRTTILEGNKKILEEAALKSSQIAVEMVNGIDNTLKDIEQLASCLAGESVAERNIRESKEKKHGAVRELEELSQERQRVATLQLQSKEVLGKLLDDYREKNTKLSSWGMTLFGWQANPKQTESPSEMTEELFLQFVNRQFVSPLPDLGLLLSKKQEKISDYEQALKSLPVTSPLKTAVNNFVEKLKNVNDDKSYKELKDLEMQMKVQYQADRSAKDRRDNLRTRRNDAKTSRERRTVEANVANEDYHNALNMYEKNEILMKDSLTKMNELQCELRKLDLKLEEEDLVHYLKQCGTQLTLIKNLMMQQATVFKNLKEKIGVDFIKRIDAFCTCFTLTANASDLDEAEEMYTRLHKKIFEVASSYIAISSYARVYAKVDRKHIMASMTDILKKAVKLSENPSPLPITYTDKTTKVVEQDIQEELETIGREVAENLKPFCKKFDIKVAIHN